jgi:hypothetical protein
MADAVEESDAIMIVMTKLYKESDACRMEADYSFQLKKNIVCCKAEADYTPDGWLGMILGSRLWYNFFDESKFETEMDNLCKKLLAGVRKKPVPNQLAPKDDAPLAPEHVDDSHRDTVRETRKRGKSFASVAAGSPENTNSRSSGHELSSAGNSRDGSSPPPRQQGRSSFASMSPDCGPTAGTEMPMMSPTLSTSLAIDPGATEGLLNAVCKSIDAAERSRDAAESRAQELEAQLHEARTQRINELELEVKRLRSENTRLRSAQRQQRPSEPRAADPADSTRGGGVEALEARVAEVHTWLAELFLSSYADGIVSEGYDALEYIWTMNDEELEQLITCDAVGMKTPHAKKFRRSVVASRTDPAAAAAAASSAPAPAETEGDKHSS